VTNNWQDDAECRGFPLSWFFEGYEEDADIASEVDDLCINCPVANQCLKYGVETNGTGVFGMVYLTLGKYSKTRNNHKMPYIQKKLENKVNEYRGK